MRIPLLPILVVGVLLPACVTEIKDKDDDDGGLCSAYEDETAEAVTRIRFRNDSGQPVYLGDSCGNVIFEVTSVDDPASPTNYSYDATCLTTCEDRQSGGIIECGACAAGAHLVPPGGTLEVTWDGTGLRPADMPEVCWENHSEGESCSQIVAAPSGTYRIATTIYSACDAFDDTGACQCDENGMCSGQASGVAAPAAPVDISFPSTAVVEVVFEVCAFGCAEG